MLRDVRIGIYGFCVQNFAFAVSTPLFLFIHLLTSPVAKPFPSTHASSVLLVSSYDLAILPFSILLGYVIPSLLMVFPGSSTISSPTHQRYIAFWQAFPLWTMIIQWTGKWMLTRLLGPSNMGSTPKSSPSGTYLISVRRIYAMALFFCLATALPALFLSIVPPSLISESWPIPAQMAETTLTAVFIPKLPIPGTPIRDLADGVHNFLQWDLYIASAAGLLWAILLHRNASTEKEIADPKVSLPPHHEPSVGGRSKNQRLWRRLILKATLWTIIAGPFGAVAVLLWERDAIVKQKVKQGI